MKTDFFVQRPQSGESQTLLAAISGQNNQVPKCKHFRVAAAYATVSGVRSILSLFDDERPEKSSWLIGLDDAISQPGALQLISELKGASLRLVSYTNIDARFHPKVFQFRFLDQKENFSIVGSANLTRAALTRNGEAVIIAESQSAADDVSFETFWLELWSQGKIATNERLEEYAALYKKAKPIRIALERTITSIPKTSPAPILSSDSAEVDPTIANTCWIECGFITAMGRELEFKAEQGMFFGLSPTGGPPKAFQFKVSSGKAIPLRMKYQGNHMWRLQMNNEVPEVRSGLRPYLPGGGLGRSPYVAVFSRTPSPDTFTLRFLKLGSSKFKRLLAQSMKSGTLGRTSARQYGWL